jgi:hypothetical protein
MKQLLLIFLSITSLQSLIAQSPRIEFDYYLQDRGKMYVGENGLFKFPYQNTGDAPLLISSVRSSCGCLVPIWHVEPIAPGAWDTIYGKYDTKRLGLINKTLTVQSNDTTKSMVTLRIKGEVLPQPFTFLEVYKKDSLKPLEISKYNRVEIESFGRDSVVLVVKNSNKLRQTFNVRQTGERPLFTTKNQEISIQPENAIEIVLKRNQKDNPTWYSEVTIFNQTSVLTIHITDK